MTEQDLPLLHEWLQQPHILEWWGGEAKRPTFAQTRALYRADYILVAGEPASE